MDNIEYVIQYLVYLAVGLLLIIFWVWQFAQLMALGDDIFPGRYDKILWVVAFIVLNVLTAIAFIWWKQTMVAVRRQERENQTPPSSS